MRNATGIAGAPKAAARHRELTQVRAEETRARILQCARDAFAEHGFAGANVRKIAKKAGTTHSMITYHFGTKDELWREAVRDMFALLKRQVVDAIETRPDLSVEERFRQFTRLYAYYCARHPEHARITVAETIHGGERLEWMVNEFVRSNHAIALPQMTELMEKGLAPSMPRESLLYAYVGMIQLPFALAKEAQLALGYDFMSDAAIERHAAAVIALVLPHGCHGS